MAAYRRVYDSRHLQADCQEPGSAPNPTLGNRVWVTFSSWWGEIWSGPSWVVVYPHGYMPRRLFQGGSVHCSVHSVRTWCRSVKGGGCIARPPQPHRRPWWGVGCYLAAVSE